MNYRWDKIKDKKQKTRKGISNYVILKNQSGGAVQECDVVSRKVMEIINPSEVFEEPHVIPAIKEVAGRVSICQEKDLANAHA